MTDLIGRGSMWPFTYGDKLIDLASEINSDEISKRVTKQIEGTLQTAIGEIVAVECDNIAERLAEASYEKIGEIVAEILAGIVGGGVEDTYRTHLHEKWKTIITASSNSHVRETLCKEFGDEIKQGRIADLEDENSRLKARIQSLERYRGY